MRDDQARVLIQGQEQILAPEFPLAPFVVIQLLVFLPDERPDFVNLDMAQRKVGKRLVQVLLTLVPEANKRPHDRVPMNSGDSLGSPDTVALQQTSQDGKLFVFLEYVSHLNSPCF